MCWSYSRLTSFEHCKYEFYLNYIVKDYENYLPEGNFYAEFGSYVHEILAKIFSGELKKEDAYQYYVDNFRGNIFYTTKESSMQKAYEACARYFEKADFDWLNDYEIVGVEKEVKFKIGKYDFVGYIDLLLKDKKDGKFVIVDNKSSEYPFTRTGKLKAKCEHSFTNYKRQMYLYAHAVKVEFGEFPKEMVWNHFKDNGQLARIPFVKSEYDKTRRWMTVTIHKIEKEEEYPATTDYFYCTNLCNFRASCEYAQKFKRK